MSTSPRPRPIPKLCHHKASGRAVVCLNGHDHYLGRWGSQEATNAYNRLIAEWLARGRRPATPPTTAPTIPGGGSSGSGPSVNEVLLAFHTHAQTHYRRPDGSQTNEVIEYKYIIRVIRELYGLIPARDFGPLALKAVREKMVGLGWARTTVNNRVRRTRHIFRWAAGEQLVPPTVPTALACVAGLQRGRSNAPEPEPIGPVAATTVAASLPYLNRHVRAMIELMEASGMRPGEVCRMTLGELDRAGEVWIYRPGIHKTSHRFKVRVVHLGPRAKSILSEFLAGVVLADDAPIFSPARERLERFARLGRLSRKTKPKRPPGLWYHPHALATVVARAAKRAAVEHWHPNQLRHTFATAVARQHGPVAAQTLLGHAALSTTEIYAERDHELAQRVASSIG